MIGPGSGTEWQAADLDGLPDDGLRYELADGVLLVSGSRTPHHQHALFELALILGPACPPHLRTLLGPIEFRPTPQRSFQPDLMVARVEDIGEKNLTHPPVLAVEVLSPGTALVDLNLKRKAYAQSGIQSYWIFDPEAEELVTHERDGENYTETGRVSGDAELAVALPFPVTVRPADLVL
ncbi:hypothetical protein Afil01_06080 [Actinorhabdospora filicis]|uniref:Putative restriction endonuclease domain-containing protein n=1 Tax=Actinorhabdospora filicis TaxID=1785913 RepID=A0A9W6W7T1_9ACTN|nr:Uma2 family endonuclease [Actinorhabdospora filicis]GLZ75801.1 hypothetical protein Afil01_06080 [Actinorhabdospora filicis]